MRLTLIELSDQDILSRLANTEDSTVERKTASDYRDCLKTAVAFSNSLPLDDPGIIFVGVYNDGRVEDNNNLDSLQRKVSEEINKIYPAILPQMKVMRRSSGKEFLAVIVRGSANRPHFAGPSYIRDGSRTLEASREQFDRLIADRSNKAREILKWRGKAVTLWLPDASGLRHPMTGSRGTLKILDCNLFYVTVESNASDARMTFSLPDLDLAYDPQNNRLELRLR